ncbi:MAG TPA: Kiwa anti-phage protein KwaB-like domain-containing protein [Bryobacteraceae bacterium]|nr:Kiwa anti-phage protein KwaB-like domain-containing protein [Bryobacteraceae bacterium]
MSLSAANHCLQTVRNLDVSAAGVSLYLASTNDKDPNPLFEQVQVTGEVVDNFRQVFLSVRDQLDDDTVLRRYEPGSKPEAYEVEYFQLDRIPEVAEQIRPLQTPLEIPLFRADDKFVDGLRFYALVLEGGGPSPAYALRIYTRQKELGRSRSFGLLFTRGQFDRVTEPLFLFDQYLDCIACDGIMLVLKQDNFQKLFRYYEMLQRTATQILARIQQGVPIANFDEFAAACQSHLQKLSKLKNISQRPYWKTITMKELKRVIKHYELPVEITRQDGNEMLVYDARDGWAILRLLDDDYLESIMTHQAYEVTGKRIHQIHQPR